MAERILLVDDHPLTRSALAALLTQHGFDVAGEASDGEEAIECAGRIQPDLILLDLSMPGVDGLSALPRLREEAPDCEVVVLTASGTEENLLGAIRGALGPRARGAPAARRASRDGRDRQATLHLRAHRPFTREEPAAQARRLLPPGRPRGAFQGTRLRTDSPKMGELLPQAEAMRPLSSAPILQGGSHASRSGTSGHCGERIRRPASAGRRCS